MSSRVYPLYSCQNIEEEKINNPIITADLVININNSYVNNFNIFNYKKNKIDDTKNNDELYSMV